MTEANKTKPWTNNSTFLQASQVFLVNRFSCNVRGAGCEMWGSANVQNGGQSAECYAQTHIMKESGSGMHGISAADNQLVWLITIKGN